MKIGFFSALNKKLKNGEPVTFLHHQWHHSQHHKRACKRGKLCLDSYPAIVVNSVADYSGPPCRNYEENAGFAIE